MNFGKKNILFLLFFLSAFAGAKEPIEQSQKTLNIYTSHGYLPARVITKFEHETGIKILVDIFDNDDVLEAKLLSGASGYDIVFPTAWPYLVRQVSAGLYQEIDFSKISHAQQIDPFFKKSLQGSHHADRFAIPFLWGIVGFAYNVDEVKKNLNQPPIDSWAMFFDPKIVRQMARCGVSMLDDPTDVIVAAKLYLHMDPASESRKDLDRVIQLLQKIRPYIKRFDISRSNDEIASGEMCLVQHWMGAIAGSYAHLGSNEKRANIQLVIPKEGTLMWLDVMAIPKTSSNTDLAYKFINFVLRPDNISIVTNETYYANPVRASLPFVDADIQANKAIFPEERVLKRIVLHKAFSPKYQKLLTRALMKIRSGR